MKRALLPMAIMAPLALAACDDGAERVTELERELETQRTTVETGAAELTKLRTELDTANARVVELEAAGTDTTALDTANARIAELESSSGDITTMEKDLAAANARIVELEAGGADTTTLDTANTRIVELETSLADTTTQLEAANARIAELGTAKEPTDADATPAVDPAATPVATNLDEPMNALVQSLREHQAALVDLQATVIDDPSARALADAALKNMRIIGRDLEQAIQAAGVTVQ